MIHIVWILVKLLLFLIHNHWAGTLALKVARVLVDYLKRKVPPQGRRRRGVDRLDQAVSFLEEQWKNRRTHRGYNQQPQAGGRKRMRVSRNVAIVFVILVAVLGYILTRVNYTVSMTVLYVLIAVLLVLVLGIRGRLEQAGLIDLWPTPPRRTT